MAEIEPNWPALLVFTVAWLTGCVGFFFLSGNLPVKAAPPAVQSGFGPMLIWINVSVLAVLILATVLFGVTQLRWTSVVVAGGFVFLFAPFIVQDLPEWLKDTHAGLGVLLVSTGLALMAVMVAG